MSQQEKIFDALRRGDIAAVDEEIARLQAIAGSDCEQSLLQAAIWESQGDIIPLLLQRGVDPYIEIFGYNAFSYARNTYRFSMLRILCDCTEESFSLVDNPQQNAFAQLEKLVQQMSTELIDSVMGVEELDVLPNLCEESWKNDFSPAVIDAIAALNDPTLPFTENVMQQLFQRFQKDWETHDWSDEWECGDDDESIREE